MRDGFYFDLDAIAAAIDAKTRIVFLDNPANPAGTIVSGPHGSASSNACPNMW